MIRLQKLNLFQRVFWSRSSPLSHEYEHARRFRHPPTCHTENQRHLSSTVSQDALESDAGTSSPESGIAFIQQFKKLVNGPPTRFGLGKIANLTASSVIGSSGHTVALATMATAAIDDRSPTSDQSVLAHLRRRCTQSSMVPLTVDYRQRHHAVGKIPTTVTRSDNRRPTDAETLASRAIDRALRPLLINSNEAIHVTCSIQACPLEDGEGGYPVSLALNSASVAMKGRLKEPIACVYVSLLEDGSVIIDPSRPHEDAVCELLYAGTRDHVVMMEYSGLLTESRLVGLIELAHGCIQPLLDAQEETPQLVKEVDVDNETLRLALGFDAEISPVVDRGAESANEKAAERIFDQAMEWCKERLGKASLKLFGVTHPDSVDSDRTSRNARPKVHPANSRPLLSKLLRGRREHLFRQEINKTLKEFQIDSSVADEHKVILQEDTSILAKMADTIQTEFLEDAMKEAAMRYAARADGRGHSGDGCVSIRPLNMEVPALPSVVHGSSVFTRGETQVLCTVTLGPPKDGVMRNDPFLLPREPDEEEPQNEDLPVGSLRYLRTQEYLESDLNSRRVRADKEQTGDSGILKERRRAFLQYDFPAYSKGEVPLRSTSSANRREIGHGALAEKAILPVLPPASEFPYAIRMTSEVTGSNGSSSMASVCGATLALLDAGVPINSPVAGVSVGLAKEGHNDDGYRLLLDITGTEDYYGSMDFKIAGTDSHVTALQLDVHQPLPLAIISEALNLAKEGRRVMLDEMKSQSNSSSAGLISELRHRSELKPSAPRVEVVRFDPMRKKDLLGPGGVVIRQMEDRFNVSLDLTQEGQCLLFGDDQDMVRKAKAAVMDLVSDVEVGGIYEGTVIELRDFGAIIELLRNKEGLCHVSELAEREEIRAHPKGTIGLVNSILHIGQKIEVECTAVDPVQGTIRLKPVSKK